MCCGSHQWRAAAVPHATFCFSRGPEQHVLGGLCRPGQKGSDEAQRKEDMWCGAHKAKGCGVAVLPLRILAALPFSLHLLGPARPFQADLAWAHAPRVHPPMMHSMYVPAPFLSSCVCHKLACASSSIWLRCACMRLASSDTCT